MRVGMGYDVHKLVEGRDLILGGVKVPHTLGLLGHSEAQRHLAISESISRIQTRHMRGFLVLSFWSM